MKISILTQFFPPDYAATGQLIEELATGLTERGHEVQVFAGQPGYAYDQPMATPVEVQQGVLIRRTRTSRIWPERIRGRAVGGVLYCLRALVKLRKRHRQGDLLLVTTEPPYLGILALALKFLYKRSYVSLIYDLYPDVVVALEVLPPGHWLVRFWQILNRQVWRQAEAIIVLSSTMRDLIASQCPEVRDKITVIHNWTDLESIQPLPKSVNTFARKQGLDRVFTILYSGNLGRCHDIETIMETALILREAPVRFVVIGKGAKLAPFKAFVEERRLSNCLFLPLQPKEMIPYSLTACDLSLVSLDKGMEGLIAPSKFYSCLAVGRPVAVICESHSYLRQIVEAADCGRAIPNGDAPALADFIETLRQSPETVERLGQHARRYAEAHFSRDHCIDQYARLIAHLESQVEDGAPAKKPALKV
ncbi:MAG: glycosyltransferase family 4 protein [Cyanobacteriota bacterium]|jgi:glycosyltransferase involved in cell wall biosynthesis